MKNLALNELHGFVSWHQKNKLILTKESHSIETLSPILIIFVASSNAENQAYFKNDNFP
jgi:hypothetical protein